MTQTSPTRYMRAAPAYGSAFARKELLMRWHSFPRVASLATLLLAMALSPAAATAGLVGHWKFDDGSPATTAADSGTAGVNGTLTSGPSWNGSGKIGTDQLNFDGSSNYVDLGTVAAADPLAFAGSNLSISAWFYDDGISGQGGRRVIDKSDGANGAGGYALWVGLSNREIAVGVDGNTFRSATGIYAFSTWTHVTAVITATGWKFYVNGVEDATAALDGGDSFIVPTSDSTDMRIGDAATITRFWTGSLDDIGLWNEALSAEKVALIHGVGDFYGLHQADASVDSLLAEFGAAGGGSGVSVGGDLWQYATGLGSTTVGTTGGTLGVDAFIVLDSSGNGVQVVPEPATGVLGLLALGLLLLSRRRYSLSGSGRNR